MQFFSNYLFNKFSYTFFKPEQRKTSIKSNLAAALVILFASVFVTGCGSSLVKQGLAPASIVSAAPNAPPPTGAPAPNPGPTPSPAPAPPALNYLALYQNIQQMTGWMTCGACGNTGATGAVANYAMTRGITTPSESGSSTEFAISGNRPYENGYWHIEYPALTSGIKKLVYEFDIYIPAADANAPEAIEFECQQQSQGWIYNFAWQANYALGTWRMFNYPTVNWEDSGIPLAKFSPDTWHHIVVEFHNDTKQHIVVHDSLTVDGVNHVVNKVHPAFYGGSSAIDKFTNAFQLDTNGMPTGYKVYVDKMNIAVQ